MSRADTLQDAVPGLTRFVRYFWPYIRQHWLMMLGSFAALLAEVAFRLLEPWPLKFVVDEVLVPATGDAVTAAQRDPSLVLLYATIAIVVIAVFRALSSYASTVGFALVGNRVLTDVRDDLYRHMQRLSLAYHHQARTGDLTIRVISDVGMLKEVAVTAFLPLVGNVLILVGMLGVMFWMNWQLALMSLIIFPLFFLRSARLSTQIQQVSRNQRQQEGDIAATASESMSAIQLIQAFSLEERFAGIFAKSNQQSLKDGVKAKRLAASLERTVDVLVAIGTAAVLWYGARLVMAGQLTAGDLLVFLAYLKNAFKPVKDFAKFTGRLAKASAAGERVVDVFQNQPTVRESAFAYDAPRLRGLVEFDDVSFGYEPGHPVLSNVSFVIRPGERVALVGGSGNGKSTLVNLLLRFFDPDKGTIKFDGTDIRNFTLESIRSQISMVPQDSVLFAATVRENIAFGAPNVSGDDVEAAARLANAHDFIMRLPNGYDTIIGERGSTLSGGQRQRIAIARAAVRRSPILILDEPTAGLDEENERAVVDALERLTRGWTSFIIAHDLKQAMRADLIMLIESGEIVERGTHEELMELEGRYASLFRMQQGPSGWPPSKESRHALTG